MQVDLADARATQTGQALGYPFNILLPVDPLTSTQVRTPAAAAHPARTTLKA
jgi:hypothetical protein